MSWADSVVVSRRASANATAPRSPLYIIICWKLHFSTIHFHVMKNHNGPDGTILKASQKNFPNAKHFGTPGPGVFQNCNNERMVRPEKEPFRNFRFCRSWKINELTDWINVDKSTKNNSQKCKNCEKRIPTMMWKWKYFYNVTLGRPNKYPWKYLSA